MNLSKPFLGLLGLGVSAPLVMGATGVPVPLDASWLPWLGAVLSPALLFLAGTGVRALVSALRADAKRNREDTDKSNDWKADVEDSVANSLESAVNKKGL